LCNVSGRTAKWATDHPEGDGWNRHLADHVRYLHELVAAGVLRASEPLKGTPLRSGFLIFTAPDRAAVEALVTSVSSNASHNLLPSDFRSFSVAYSFSLRFVREDVLESKGDDDLRQAIERRKQD